MKLFSQNYISMFIMHCSADNCLVKDDVFAWREDNLLALVNFVAFETVY